MFASCLFFFFNYNALVNKPHPPPPPPRQGALPLPEWKIVKKSDDVTC